MCNWMRINGIPYIMVYFYSLQQAMLSWINLLAKKKYQPTVSKIRVFLAKLVLKRTEITLCIYPHMLSVICSILRHSICYMGQYFGSFYVHSSANVKFIKLKSFNRTNWLRYFAFFVSHTARKIEKEPKKWP